MCPALDSPHARRYMVAMQAVVPALASPVPAVAKSIC